MLGLEPILSIFCSILGRRHGFPSWFPAPGNPLQGLASSVWNLQGPLQEATSNCLPWPPWRAVRTLAGWWPRPRDGTVSNLISLPAEAAPLTHGLRCPRAEEFRADCPWWLAASFSGLREESDSFTVLSGGKGVGTGPWSPVLSAGSAGGQRASAGPIPAPQTNEVIHPLQAPGQCTYSLQGPGSRGLHPHLLPLGRAG